MLCLSVTCSYVIWVTLHCHFFVSIYLHNVHCLQVRAAVHSRADALTRFNRDGAKAVAAHLRNIDTLAAQVQQQYSSILAGPAPAQAAPVPALAAAAPAALSAGRAPAPAAAAPAPAAAPAAPSGPTYTPPASLAALANAPAPARTPGGRGAGRPSTARCVLGVLHAIGNHINAKVEGGVAVLEGSCST